MENFFELIAKRESCRNFAPKKVEQKKLVTCIEVARLAPSACNSQPWNFVVVTHSDYVPKIASCLQELGMNSFTNQCPAFIIVAEGKAVLSAKIAGKIKDQAFAENDIGIATAHLCLAATELGLSTCIMGWFQEKKLKELLSIPESQRIRLVLAIGYAATDTLRPKKRKALSEIATFITEDKTP